MPWLFMYLQALMQDEIFMSNTERFEVKARIKQPYSVWKKLSKNNCTLDELYDIVALRIVCSPLCEPGTSPEEAARRGEELCRYACSVVHKLRPHYPSRFKDYIQKPKQNGYQSLHTSLQMRLAGNSCPFEVQIRTHEMHQVAEYGLASHSIYKGKFLATITLMINHIRDKAASGTRTHGSSAFSNFQATRASGRS